MKHNPLFHRLEILTGADGLAKLHKTRVILFGVGGVGSWCAESLIRSGIGSLTIVDSDVVCVTNVNRQLQATIESVGKVKVTELAGRLRLINPEAVITPMQKIFKRADAPLFELDTYDYVVDAIDSLSHKVDLIIAAHESGAKVYTALGASNKLDPMQIKVGSLWESQGCPLGKFVRKRLRRRGFDGDVTCVYSEENLPLHSVNASCGKENCVCPKKTAGSDEASHEWCSEKKQINGSIVHITAMYGFIISGLVVKNVLEGEC